MSKVSMSSDDIELSAQDSQHQHNSSLNFSSNDISLEAPVIGYIRNGINRKVVEICSVAQNVSQKTFSFDIQIPNNIGWTELKDATLLHAAAVYNNPYIMRYLLDDMGAQISSQTQGGLTALQVSCGIGNAMAVDILLSKGSRLNPVDVNGSTALQYAIKSGRRLIVLMLLRFLGNNFSPTDSDEKSLEDSATDPEMKNFVREILTGEYIYMWAPLNVNIHICTNPMVSRRVGYFDFCNCGQPIEVHNADFNNLYHDKDWSVSDLRILPTNAFGEIEFSGLSQTAKFVRLSHETNEQLIQSLFLNYWKLKRPSMVICVYGNECNSVSLQSIISKGIWKSIGHSNAMIITNGVNHDVVRMVGEAVRDYCDAYGSDSITSLGIPPWNIMMHRDVLISDDYGGSYPSVYPVQKANFSEITLNPNCSHFLMADTGLNSQFGAEYQFRGKVEKCVTQWESWGEDNVVKRPLPSCGMLVAGDRSTLKEVHYCIVVNECPLVCLKGTGGLADIISELLDDRSNALSEESAKNSMTKNWLLSESEVPDPSEIKMLISVMKQKHIIEVFSTEDGHSTDLDGSILSSLLSSASPTTDDMGINIGQLEIVLTLDRSDVAKSKVFSDQKSWDRGELDEPFFKALLDTKVGFIKLFIEQGFRLDKYVTPALLERLYNTDYTSERKMHILRSHLPEHTSSKDWLTLQDIGKAIVALIGSGFYSPIYLKEDFYLKCRDAPDTPVDRPARELFLWALLTTRIELASFFWTLQRESMAGGLFAAILLRIMSKKSADVVDQEDFEDSSNTFEQYATGVLDECYNEDQRKAMECLTKELPYFGDTTCLILAAEGESIKFIAHRCCLELLKNIWFGGINRSTSFMKFFFSVMFGMIPSPLVAFIMDYEENPLYYNSAVVDSYNVQALQSESKNNRNKWRNKWSLVWRKTKMFYTSPLVKFLYSTFSYFLYLMLFSYIMLFDLVGAINPIHGFVFSMFLGLVFEELRQAFRNGTSFSSYISDAWNKLDVCAISLFIVGSVMYCSTQSDQMFESMFVLSPNTQVFLTGKESLIRISRIFLAFSLFIYYTRLLQVLSISINLGPKVLMIFRMVVKDLIPFMIIFLIFVIAYGVMLYSITFPLSPPTITKFFEQLYDMMRTAYFESFGEFRLGYLTNEPSECTAGQNCPDYVGRWASLVLVGIYLLITNVLLLNMLIAMFSNTYDSIQSNSIQYWTLQRYTIIQEYTERSVAPPPFNILWILLSLPISFCYSCNGRIKDVTDGPFLHTYRNNKLRGRQLVQWERLRVLEYLRSLEDGRKKKKKSKGTVYVNRTSVLSANSANVKKELSDVSNELGDKFKESLKDVESQLLRLDTIEDQLSELQEAVLQLSVALKNQPVHVSHRGMKMKEKKNKKSPASLQPAVVSQPPRTPEIPQKIAPVEKVSPPPSPVFHQIPDKEAMTEADEIDAGYPIETVNKSKPEVGEYQSSTLSENRTKSELDDELIPLSILSTDMNEPFVWEFRVNDHHHFSRMVPYNADATSKASKIVSDWKQLQKEKSIVRTASFYVPSVVRNSLFDETVFADSPSTKDLIFNEWDKASQVNRKTILNSYQVKDDRPLNPKGRQGVAGRGHLPFWGPNHTVHFLFTRWKRDDKDEIIKRQGKKVLQTLAVKCGRLYQLPWYFLQHQKSCDFHDCVKRAVNEFLHERLNDLHQGKLVNQRSYDTLSQSLKRFEPIVIYQGLLDDYINADNAWIETVAINCHDLYSHNQNNIFMKLLQHDDQQESIEWLDVFDRRLFRVGHLELCEKTSQYLNAAF